VGRGGGEGGDGMGKPSAGRTVHSFLEPAETMSHQLPRRLSGGGEEEGAEERSRGRRVDEGDVEGDEGAVGG